MNKLLRGGIPYSVLQKWLSAGKMDEETSLL